MHDVLRNLSKVLMCKEISSSYRLITPCETVNCEAFKVLYQVNISNLCSQLE